MFVIPKENFKQHSPSLVIFLSSGVAKSLMAPGATPPFSCRIRHSGLYRSSAVDFFVVGLQCVAQSVIPAEGWQVLTQSLAVVGVWDLPLSYIASHDLCSWSIGSLSVGLSTTRMFPVLLMTLKGLYAVLSLLVLPCWTRTSSPSSMLEGLAMRYMQPE